MKRLIFTKKLCPTFTYVSAPPEQQQQLPAQTSSWSAGYAPIGKKPPNTAQTPMP